MQSHLQPLLQTDAHSYNVPSSDDEEYRLYDSAALEIRGQSSTRTETKGQKKVVDVKLVFHLVAYIRNSGKTNGGMVAFVHVNANFPENGLPKVLPDNLFGG